MLRMYQVIIHPHITDVSSHNTSSATDYQDIIHPHITDYQVIIHPHITDY